MSPALKFFGLPSRPKLSFLSLKDLFIVQVDQLTLFPFPGLKIINIRGSALLTLDLIIINHFVTRLQPENQLLELSLRDQVCSF